MARWVYAVAKAGISFEGDIDLSLEDLEVREGRRPIEPTEGFSPNPEGLQAIRVRRPGLWSSSVFLGGATVVLAPFSQLETLPQEGLDRLWQKYGPWYEDVVLCAVRNTMAPALWNVAEPFGGSAEIADLKLARDLELGELGLYRRDPGGVTWPVFTGLAPSLCGEQCRIWAELDKDARTVGAVNMTPRYFGCDSFAGEQCVVSVGPVGDLTIVRSVGLDLRSRGWCIRDGELDGSGQPLNRKMVMIARREGRSPIMFELAPDGGLDPCGLHVPLSREVLEYNVSHLTREALGPYGLGWLR